MRTKQEYQDALDKLGKIDIEIGESRGHKLYEDIKTIYGSTFDKLQELIDNLTKDVWIPIKRENWSGEVVGECCCGAWVSDKEDYCCRCGIKFDWESKDPTEENYNEKTINDKG